MSSAWTSAFWSGVRVLTLWGRVTHTCVGNLTIIGPYNGLSPGRRQAIIWTNASILLNGPWGTNFSEILIEIHTFSVKKTHWKMSSGKRRPFCLGLNVLKLHQNLYQSNFVTAVVSITSMLYVHLLNHLQILHRAHDLIISKWFWCAKISYRDTRFREI